MSIYHVTERLVVDDELEFKIDTERAVQLINAHQAVACGTFEEAETVLLRLGLTDSSIRILFVRAIGLNDMENEPDALQLPG